MKKPKHLATSLTLAIAIAAAALGGCEGAATSHPSSPNSTAEGSPISLPSDLFTDVSPDGAMTLLAARSSAQPGDEVTVSGKVGGRAAPFIGERAIFTLADESLEFCRDECAVPWDACCVPTEEIAAMSSTVQVVDAEGNPLRVGLEGQGGLAPAAHVTIRGTVAEGQGDAFVINATQIHVSERAPGA